MENYHEKVRERLGLILDELGGKNLADVYHEDNKFIITFPTTYTEGYKITSRLLDNFKEADIIDSDQLTVAKNGVINKKIITSGAKCDLSLVYNPEEHSVNIIFKPHLGHEELYKHLDKSLEIARGTNNLPPDLAVKNLPTTINLSRDTSVRQIGERLRALNKIKSPLEVNEPITDTESMEKANSGFNYVGVNRNGEFIISYEAGYNGKNRIKNFLSLLEHADIISKHEISKITLNSVKSEVPISNDKLSLAIGIKNDNLQITLKPNNLEEFKDALYVAINRAASHSQLWENDIFSTAITEQEKDANKKYDLIIAQQTENKTKQILPENAKPIYIYLKEKVKAAFPDRDIKITYLSDDRQKLKHSLVITVNSKKEPESEDLDNKKLQAIIKDLGGIFEKGGMIQEVKTDISDRIGLRVNFNPYLLLKDIDRNDGKNFVQIQHQSLTR